MQCTNMGLHATTTGLLVPYTYPCISCLQGAALASLYGFELMLETRNLDTPLDVWDLDVSLKHLGFKEPGLLAYP